MPFADAPRTIQSGGGLGTKYISYATTNAYVEKTFGKKVYSITLSNTHASDPVQWSYDGATLEGELDGGSPGQSISVVNGTSSIWLKSTAGTATVRVWGW